MRKNGFMTTMLGLGLAAVGMMGTKEVLGAIPNTMHPDFDLSQVGLPAAYKTMGMGFLKDGRMVLGTTVAIGGGEVPPASADHKLFIVSGISKTGSGALTVKEIANNWHQIAGIVIAEDKVYVSDRDGFYRIDNIDNPTDLAGNRTLIVKWPDENHWPHGFSWHQWVFTPVYFQGFFYAPYSGCIVPGGPSGTDPTTAYSGAFLKWDLSGKLEKFAGGLRSPNGANINPAGEMFVADNQGSWLPSSTFMQMKQGKFYGHKQSDGHAPNWAESLPYERPTAWLDNGALRTSPSQPVFIDKGRYQGDWLLGDVNNPGLVRIALDKVGDTYNGSVFWFGQGMGNAAINRMAWGPDGSLYIGTLTKIGNWPSGDEQPMYKLTPKAAAGAFEPRMVRSLADGVELLFTEPVDKASVVPANFTVQTWNYTRQAGYGLGKSVPQKLTVSAADLSDDGLRVHLVIAGLKEDFVTYIKLGTVKPATGAETLWNNEAWFTLNAASPRAWSATSAIAEAAPETSPLAGKVHYRLSASRSLDVEVDMPGLHIVTLRSLNGAVLQSVQGEGQGRQQLNAPGLGHGLYLLEVKQGAETLRLPIALAN